jgi:hypothetical protein
LGNKLKEKGEMPLDRICLMPYLILLMRHIFINKNLILKLLIKEIGMNGYSYSLKNYLLLVLYLVELKRRYHLKDNNKKRLKKEFLSLKMEGQMLMKDWIISNYLIILKIKGNGLLI